METMKVLTKPRKLYTLSACENLIQKYLEIGGDVVTLVEGTLGLGLTVCYCEGYKTAVITEIPLNCWESAHSVRMYNKMPEKYQKMIDELEDAEIAKMEKA